MVSKKFNLKKYKTFIFDCDGVCLNSNKIKSNAFYQIAESRYGVKIANIFLNYHIQNGGISRENKFKYLITNIVKDTQVNIEYLCNEYAKLIFDKLLKSEFSEDLYDLKKEYSIPWMIISGSNEKELNKIFSHRKLESLFELGIYGSPKDKDRIFNENKKKISLPALYFGDSKYDYDISKKNDIDFCFITKWTDFRGWKKFFQEKDDIVIRDFREFLN